MVTIETTLLLLIGTLIATGTSTFFLKVGVIKIGETHARFFRVLTQTVWIILILTIVFGRSTFYIPLQFETIYVILNGVCAGIAFISFTRSLKVLEAGTARTLLNLNIAITIVLGILVLGESLTIKKTIGSVMALTAMFLLTSKRKFIDELVGTELA